MCEALRDFSTAAIGACDKPTDAVGKSVLMLRDCLREAPFIKDSELVHRRLPLVRSPAPVGGDIAQRQPDQLGCGIVARKVLYLQITNRASTETQLDRLNSRFMKQEY